MAIHRKRTGAAPTVLGDKDRGRCGFPSALHVHPMATLLETEAALAPAYLRREVAAISGLTPKRLSRWCASKATSQVAIVHPPEGPTRRLNLVNVIQASFVRRLADSGMRLDKIRQAELRARSMYKMERYALLHAMHLGAALTDLHRFFFVDDVGIESTEGQRVLAPVVEDLLHRLDVRGGQAVFRPYGALAVLAGEYGDLVEFNTARDWGRPYFRKSGAPVAAVLRRLHSDDPIEWMVDDFGLHQDELAEARAIDLRRH